MTSRPWIEPPPVSVDPDFLAAIGGHPLVAETLYRRGLADIHSAQGFMDPALFPPVPPQDLPDIDLAVDLIIQMLQAGKKIFVWGDFDVDGQTATTLLVSALRRLGAEVDFHIPVRANESHGISLPVLQSVIASGIDLLLTCDTGITANDAVSLARSHGLPVIITDHHDLPEQLPDASAIINPKRLSPEHASATLPGVGVAYKLIQALYAALDRPENTSEFLDLVALGIVADVAYIRGETRSLLQLGLPVLRQMPRLGLQVLCELAELDPANITEEHISFVLAPRLNALGRLADANSIVEFLTTTDQTRARTLAYELEGLNANRRMLSDQIFRAALGQLEADPTLLENDVIVLAHPTWPAGVIGITAARLVERFARPAILFSSPPGVLARGSARSIEGINITAAIGSQADLIEGFGGHPMAAGLSIQPDRIPDFRRRISREVKKVTLQRSIQTGLAIDGYLPLNSLSLDLVADFERLAPFGPGNPAIVLGARDLTLTGYAAVGKHGEHLLMSVEDDLGYAQQVIWWQGADQPLPSGKFDLAFTVRASTYRGQRAVQLEWIDFRPLAGPPISQAAASPILVVDYRHDPHPLETLATLRANHELLIWCEDEDRPQLGAVDRTNLRPCPALAIWTVPPGPAELTAAVQAVSPGQVFLFGHLSAMDQPEAFLVRLAGLVKYAINQRHGESRLSTLAAGTNQHLETVHLGLQWLQMNGHLQFTLVDSELLHLEAPSGSPPQPSASVVERLRSLLTESAAYRRYYLQADKDTLING